MKMRFAKRWMAFLLAAVLCVGFSSVTPLAAGEPESGPVEGVSEALPETEPQEPPPEAEEQEPGSASQEDPAGAEPDPTQSPDPAMFTVLFLGDDGALLSEQSVPQGGAAQAPEAPGAEGKTFIGWDADFSQVQSDLTVHAIYEANRYQIIFVLANGEKTVVAEHGTTIADADIPTVENLLGWTEAGGREYMPDELKALAIVSDLRLTPVVADPSEEPAEESAEEPTEDPVEDPAKKPVAEPAKADEEVVLPQDDGTMFYTVYYNLDGGTGTLPVDYKAYQTGNQATALPTDAEKDGDVFAGWIIQGGNGTVYEPGQKVPITNSNITLVATYEQKGAEVFFMEYIVDIPGVGEVSKIWYSDKNGWLPSAPDDLFIEYGILIDLWKGQGGMNKDPVAPGNPIYLNNMGMPVHAVSFHYVYTITFQAGANGGFAETSQNMVMYYPVAGGTPWASAVAMVPTPVPAAGYYFDHWERVTPAPTANLGMSPAWAGLYPVINATYVFRAVFTSVPPSVSVTFQVDPANGSGGKLHDNYHSGGALQNSVIVTATPGTQWQSALTAGVPAPEAATGYYFAGWVSSNPIGAPNPADNAPTLQVTQDLVYTARFLPKDNLVVTITGNHDSRVYTGALQSVTGFDWDQKDKGVSVALASGAAYAARTDVGTTQMNLAAGQFTVTAPAQYTVTVVVVDGYIEITPAPITGTLSLTGGSGVYKYTQPPAYTIADAAASITGTYQIEYIWRASSGSWSAWSTTKPTFQDVETYSIQARAVGTGNYAIDPPVYLMSNIATYTVTPYPVKVRLTAAPEPVPYSTDPGAIAYGWTMAAAPNTWLDTADPTAGFANEGAITVTSAYTDTTPSGTVLPLSFGTAPVLKDNQYGAQNYTFTYSGVLCVTDTDMVGSFTLSPGGGVYTANPDYSVALTDEITEPEPPHTVTYRWGRVAVPDDSWTDWGAQPYFEDVGVYYVQAKASDDDYKDFLSNIETVTVTPAPLGVLLKATPDPVPYGTDPGAIVYDWSIDPGAPWLGGGYDGFSNEPDIDVTSGYTATTNAGQTLGLYFAAAPVLQQNQNGFENYTLSWSGTLDVEAAELAGTLELDGIEGVYTASPDYFATVKTAGGFNGPYTLSYQYKTPADASWQDAGTSPRFEEVATYQVRAIATAASPDYTGSVTSAPVDVKITPAGLVVTPTASPASVAYGTAPAAISYGYTVTSWLGGNYDGFATAPVAGSAYTDTSPAGTPVPLGFTTQPVVEDNLYGAPNYAVALGEGSLAVTAAEIDFGDLKVNDQTKVYTTADPANSLNGWPGGLDTRSVSGASLRLGSLALAASLDPGDFTVSFSRVPGEDVDTGAGYTISATIVSNSPNYIVVGQPADGKLNITPAHVTVQGDTLGIIFGARIPDATAQVLDKPAAGVEVVYTAAYDRAVDGAGKYEIVVTADPDKNPNYIVSTINGSLTVAPIGTEVLIVIGNHFKTYGDRDPQFTSAITGLHKGDILRYLLRRAIGENVTADGYEITADLPAHPNYSNIVVVPGRFTILERPVTLTAGSYTKTEGAEDPTFDASITAGNLVFEDVLDYTLARTNGETAGSYPVTITLGDNPNYDVTVVPGTLTIVAEAPATPLFSGAQPQTGVGSNLALWLVVALAAGGVIFGLLYWRKRWAK